MSGCPLSDVLIAVELRSAEEVGERVVDARTVHSAYGHVVREGQAVQLPQQAGEQLAARRLSIDDMHVGCVVDVEQHGLTRQQRGVGGRAGDHCQKLAPSNLCMRMVEVGVFRGVVPAECSPYPEVLGPRRRVDRTTRWRGWGLQVEAEAGEAGI